jgi:glycosyltransferase involved in cell wall biosynthesis
MNVSIVLETRYLRTPDGNVWTKGPCTYSFWARYLSVFEGIKVIARVKQVVEVDGSYHLANGANVVVCAVPYYIGPYEYAKSWRSVGQAVREAIGMHDALLLRVPGAIAGRAVQDFWRTGRPYGAEVVGDPFEVFAPGIFEHPLRPLLRYLSVRALERQCAKAAAASYVTEKSLQRRYPCRTDEHGVSDVQLEPSAYTDKARAYEIHNSSVELSAAAFKLVSKSYEQDRDTKLMFIGSMEQKYKGLDVLLKALAELRLTGSLVTLTVIGEGRYRAEMEELTRQLSLDRIVRFLGELPSGQSIRDELDRSTVLVVPSRTEGLPRVILEAMARSVPCIASKVGGIPELLQEEDMVPANNVSALVKKIDEVISSPERMRRMSERNLSRARDYRIEVLQARREEFLRALRARTEEWMNR